jgi:hypothetical protein
VAHRSRSAALCLALVECRVDSLRILSLGDSIDRNLLLDWCDWKKGRLCQAVAGKAGVFRPTSCASDRSHPIPLYDLFPRKILLSSWEISICDDHDSNVTLGLLFNKQGVSPYPPWHHPKFLEMEDYDLSQPKTVKHLFNYFLRPALPGLLQALGGPPHAISINSCLWDLAHVFDFNGSTICSSPLRQQNLIHSWAKNITLLIDSFPSTRWMGWRMSHNISRPPPCRLAMIQQMNSAARQIIVSKKMHWEPWLADHRLVNVEMRDETHPGPAPNIAHMSTLIDTIRRDLERRRAGSERARDGGVTSESD